MSQFEEIPSPGRGFQGSRALGGLAACKTLASIVQAIGKKACHAGAAVTAEHRCSIDIFSYQLCLLRVTTCISPEPP